MECVVQCLVFIFASQFCSGYYTLYDFTWNQAQMVVNEHNRLRALEPAADMQQMVWNAELALVAKDWASRCAAMHRPGNERVNRAGFGVIGENIWWTTEPYLRGDLASIIRDFYNEKQFYSYSTGWCQPGQMCGHYTQVVWAKSCAVGCAASYCEYIQNGRGITTGHMVVCNYGPAGNYPSQFPYTYGSNCASCPGSCVNGLCASTCAANRQSFNWWQPPVATPRAPVQPAAAVARPQIPLLPQPPRVPQVAKPKPVNPVVQNFNPNAIRTEIISTDCLDRHNFCTFWGGLGECGRNPRYMNLYCKNTCDSRCQRSQPIVPEPQPKLPSNVAAQKFINKCVDLDALCTFWAANNECVSNAVWMSNNCYGSCHMSECSGRAKTIISGNCVDQHPYCVFWTTTGECSQNSYYMQWQCRKSCNYC